MSASHAKIQDAWLALLVCLLSGHASKQML